MNDHKRRKVSRARLTVCCLLALTAMTVGCSRQSPKANSAKPSDMSPAAREAMHRDMMGPSAAPASPATH